MFYLVSICLLLISCGGGESRSPSNLNTSTLTDEERQRRTVLPLVEECAARSGDNTFRVSGFSKQICRLPDLYQRSFVNYTIGKAQTGDGFNIELLLRPIFQVNIDKFTEESRKLEEIFDKCVPEVKGFFARYNLYLNLRFIIGIEYHHAEAVNVSIYPTEGVSNSNEWYFGDRSARTCQMIAHEVGHLLGFDDEYGDDRCPDRTVYHEWNPPSIMKYAGLPFHQLALYPRHIHSILHPFCPVDQGVNGVMYNELPKPPGV